MSVNQSESNIQQSVVYKIKINLADLNKVSVIEKVIN